jgi:hypothetical protein
LLLLRKMRKRRMAVLHYAEIDEYYAHTLSLRHKQFSLNRISPLYYVCWQQ